MDRSSSPVFMPAQQLLEELASLDVFMSRERNLDAELGIVAIYSRDILSLHVVEITGKQHRHGGLAHTLWLLKAMNVHRLLISFRIVG